MKKIICERCGKKFYNKSHLDDHLNRKIPCIPKKINNIIDDDKDNYCKQCNKYFSRPYTLKRHFDTIHNKNSTPNTNNATTKKGNINQVIATGDNSKIIINQYNLFSFSKDGTDCLDENEKVEIFFSPDGSPIEMIIIKVNLDPNKINHHNVGYTDNHLGVGIIFDGNRWISERIDVILQILLESKEKDLLKIYEEIKDFLKDDTKNTIKNTLNDLNKILYPTNKININAKRKLTAHLKKHFFNNRNLVLEAMKYTDNKKITTTNNQKNNLKNILKDGVTIKDVAKGIQLKKRINLKKEIAIHTLNKLIENMNGKEYKLLIDIINQTDNIKDLSTITHLLDKSYCFGNKISDKLIQHKINESIENDKILFNN